MTLPGDTVIELYSVDPADFLSARARLVSDAKQSGDRELARRIGAVRKPTVAAWVVNRQVHADASVVDRLLALGSQLRTAHEALDAAALRDLSGERRLLVGDLTSAALADAGRADAGATLRDEVYDTFDAAVADPQIAARLGTLTRPEKWSGFGVAPDVASEAPELTVIRGGRDRPTSAAKTTTGTRTTRTPNTRTPNTRTPTTRTPSSAGTPEPGADPVTTREDRARDRARASAREKARTKATRAFEAADAALRAGDQAEHDAGERVHDLDAQLRQLQSDLEAARRDHDRSKRELRSARNRRREARAALDRAERADP